MKTRAITGVFFIIILVGAHLLGREVFVAFFSLLGLASLAEFYKLIGSEESKPNMPLGILAGVALMIGAGGAYLDYWGFKMMLLAVPFVLWVYIAALYQEEKLPFQGIGFTLLGLVYTVFPFLALVGLAFVQGSFNYLIPLGYLILQWSNDTGAYLAGRSFGKRKLFERISPNKTWEGFIGGVLLAVVVALNLSYYFGSLEKWHWVVMGLTIGVFGTLGDLVESMLKRSLDVKDSGKILPGHGGFLDRFDGVLIAAPLVYVFLMLVL
ncbi:phosphatidate cytidylyltransferase [Sphingobacterium sp. SYP-B4668]|uniref:phosphatidate cytidylyltransferase n=1 Tax=Sphingobacterium sp. SYP-B4668 TaxID=2996035 RepID=UPI0022DE63A1|nr:phosphatidate cytidylyltransferase [Sphingobacterium sp. SYP-B4668]